MPTYEYACRECNQHLEVVQSFSEDPLTTCGACGGQLRKVFSAAGIIFKGSGYYVTDSRKAARAAAKSAKAPSGADSKSSDGSSSSEGSTSSDSSSASESTTSTEKTKSSGDAKPAGEAKSA